MKPTRLYNKEHRYNLFKKERFVGLWHHTPSFLIYTASLAALFSFYLIFYPKNVTQTTSIQVYSTNSSTELPNDVEKCDLFQGRWVPDASAGSLYTNYSCKTIPFARNCFMHGRRDTEFLRWRWKPDQCELPRFQPEVFLSIVRGKTMAFIGDSLARNHMESLLCLLSTAETPRAKHKDPDDRLPIWEFQKQNFTLMTIRSEFLVSASERVVNGSNTGGFHLHLDEIDTNWSEKLPEIDYAVFSDAHWFSRQNYLYERGNLIGCVYCQTPHVTDLGPGLAIRKAFRTAFKRVNSCRNCRRIFSLLRTYSPSHFENGAWNEGGRCNRTRPTGKEEIDMGRADFEYRRIQVEEVESAREAGVGHGNAFEILDVTKMMLMRPDGHPDVHWGNQWMKGYSDCIHWCLPGPIDTWNQLMLEMIKKWNHNFHVDR
ncbi:protein ALTERED XYLOGLUCAN 4-like [Dorcoceras hygrometricum]|uniref:Protein ALTERED XYLOGLUCAN 4-like n=1 Tax=Dorcoceras hygrometricum TaxID=472368 RepID=A0A2Z7BPA4_9LAMI|nr:protein ALTERED XYLOGLUCAN 4-like [Dorcoceras hygrometricum]